MSDKNIKLTERERNRFRKAKAEMLEMTWKWKNKLCTTRELDLADLNYMEARAQR